MGWKWIRRRKFGVIRFDRLILALCFHGCPAYGPVGFEVPEVSLRVVCISMACSEYPWYNEYNHPRI